MVEGNKFNKNKYVALLLIILLIAFTFLSVGRQSMVSGSPGEGSQDLTGGLIAYWPFDEGIGDIAFDEGKYHNDLGLMCASTTCSPRRWAAGRIGSAVALDGEDDYLWVGGSEGLTGMSELTIAAWIHGNRFNQNATVISISIPYVDRSGRFLAYYIGLFQEGNESQLGRFSFGISQGEGTGVSVRSTTNLDLGQWYHIVAVFKADAYLRIYIDGGLDSSKLVSIQRIAVPSAGDLTALSVGRYAGFFAGMVDEIRIYGRALSEEEIAQLYEGEDIRNENL